MRKNFSFFSFLFVVIACSLFLATSIQAASIKDRMAGRIPAINSLKDQGTIGENNMGFLEYRTGSKPKQQLVADENKDRGAVYGAIAKKQGSRPGTGRSAASKYDSKHREGRSLVPETGWQLVQKIARLKR